MLGRVRLIVTIALVVALALFVVYKVQTSPEWRSFSLHRFLGTLAHLDYRFLVIALVSIYSTYLLRSLRWREFLLPIKRTHVPHLVSATIIGFAGLALLGRPGELLRPYLIARKEDMAFTTQMAVWVVERVYDLSMVIFVIGGAFYFSRGLSEKRAGVLAHLSTAGLSILMMSGAGVIVLLLFRRYWTAWLPWLSDHLGFLPAGFRARLLQVLEDFGAGLSALKSRRASVMGVIYTAAIWFSISVGYFLTLKAFGPPLSEFSFVAALIVMGFAIAGSMLQVPGIGGGTQVFTILALTELFGVRPEMATSAAIILFLLTFVAVVPPALVLVFREGLTWRKLRVLATSETTT